jgi:tetratricopeptide (TPR) repeat protein
LWADHDTKLDEALAIAAREHASRKDIFTADIYAWCLYKKGQFQEAKTVVAEAMRLKTKDARIFYHAGMIEKSLGNKKAAAGYLKKALETNQAFDILQAENAKKALGELL